MKYYIQTDNEELENQSVMAESRQVWASLLFLFCKSDAQWYGGKQLLPNYLFSQSDETQ